MGMQVKERTPVPSISSILRLNIRRDFEARECYKPQTNTIVVHGCS